VGKVNDVLKSGVKQWNYFLGECWQLSECTRCWCLLYSEVR